jgi:Ni,Fe-hydrogenase III large subunit
MHETMLPIGPYHPALKEPEYFRLFIEGEVIKDAQFQLGYNHRGIEKLLESKTYIQSVPLIEKICAICNHAHTTCFSEGIEKLNGIEIPARAKYIRTIASELERIQSHYLVLGEFADTIGFETLFMHIWKERELVMELFELFTGNRVSRILNIIGGVRWDIDDHLEGHIRQSIRKIEKYAIGLEDTFAKDSLIKARISGHGVLSKERAKELNVVGPVARASGIAFDVRKELPYSGFADMDFDVIVEDSGDSMARTLVRVREIVESCKIIKQCLDNLPRGKLSVPFSESVIGEITQRVEAPRGEDLHFIITGKDRPSRVRIRPPTYANIAALEDLLAGEKVADAAPIILSLDPCFSCTDRIAIIDEKGDVMRI